MVVGNVLRTTVFDLLGVLGAIIVVLAGLHLVANSMAVESLAVDILGPAAMMPLEIVRLVAQHSIESGSIWLGAAILAFVFVGAAIDFALGNFSRQLAAATGVRLDAIETLNPDWDGSVAAAASLGSMGAAPAPGMGDGGAPSQQHHQSQQQQQAPEDLSKYRIPKTSVKQGRKG